MPDRAKSAAESTATPRRIPRTATPAPRTTASPQAAVPRPRGARVPPGPGVPAEIRTLQGLVGNAAVMRMLAAREPDSPAAGPAYPVQRAVVVGEEEERDAPNGAEELEEVEAERSVQRAGNGSREPSDAEVHAAAAEGVRTAFGPLPFLDRIQRSFGRHSVGHVKGHVGDKATRASHAMGALAFATSGHVVFAGAPDLRTAAHEAAHVIQQQGGVQLAGGVGREGDAYERHADAVADAVVAGRSAEALLDAASGGIAIQRLALIVNRRDGALDPFIQGLEATVAHHAAGILARPLVAEIDGYTRRWNIVYQRFRDGYDDPFLYSAYGYAVESYTLKDLPPLPPALAQQGWTVHTQVSRGMTRPDIVVMDGAMKEQAWIDITSAASSGHIGNKTGTGWRTRPYVCEILYPSLDKSQLGHEEMSPEEKQLREAEVIRMQAESAARAEIIRRELPDVRGINKRDRRRYCEEHLGDFFQIGDKLTPNATRSVLVFVEQWTEERNLLTEFGYTGDHHRGRDHQTADLLINGIPLD